MPADKGGQPPPTAPPGFLSHLEERRLATTQDRQAGRFTKFTKTARDFGKSFTLAQRG